MAETQLDNSRRFYVLDTNVIVDYPGIIPGVLKNQPEEASIDLRGSHIIIPTAVIRELSSFKREKNERGKASRMALKRIRELFEGTTDTMRNIYTLNSPIYVEEEDLNISILPVHKDFKNCLPFSPSDTDMDGQIILTTIAVQLLSRGPEISFIDGTKEARIIMNYTFSKNVVLLTNDNGLAIRARERGITTSRYGYKYPEPYTGRRDLVVPKELFDEFYSAQRIDLELWCKLMPDQPELVANEFIVMRLENREDYPPGFDPDENPYFCHIGRYDADEEAILKLKYTRSFPTCLCNAGQAIYAEALMNPNIAAVICTGPAGSGKTYMATAYGYQACKDGAYIGVTVVPRENRSKIGALPGDLDEKMDQDTQPIKNALRNYLLNEDSKFRKEISTLKKYGAELKDEDSECPNKRSIKKKLVDRIDLIWDNWFSNIPIESAGGRDFAYELAIYDEFQDQNATEANTLITRIGACGKIIITGDLEQIHAPYLDQDNNGIVYASRQLYNSPMVAQVCFTEEEVIRHPLVRMIATRQKTKKPQQ